jgi:death-on-curing protein
LGRTFETLTKNEILEINRRMIEEFGGFYLDFNDNLLNPSVLEHVLVEIESSIFEQDLYPEIIQKAGILAWRINAGHVFYDGNKRTSVEVCRLFLEINGFELKLDVSIIDIAIKIARNEISFQEFLDWLRNNIINL